jgi:hypothetical protein
VNDFYAFSSNLIAPILVYPRSASEAIFDNSNKFRQLPCRTFISVGTCPYRERCMCLYQMQFIFLIICLGVYLHDPRCICREAKTKTRRKNKEDVVLDSMFWPVMPVPLISQKLDSTRQPHVIQPFNVPMPINDEYCRHDQAVYSLWMHFVDFCVANNESSPILKNLANGQTISQGSVLPCFSAPDTPMNAYTHLFRLPVFRKLSSGESLDPSTLSDTTGVIQQSSQEYSKSRLTLVASPLGITELCDVDGDDATLLAPVSSEFIIDVKNLIRIKSVDSFDASTIPTRRSSFETCSGDEPNYFEQELPVSNQADDWTMSPPSRCKFTETEMNRLSPYGTVQLWEDCNSLGSFVSKTSTISPAKDSIYYFEPDHSIDM